jgi:hypothetical protein
MSYIKDKQQQSHSCKKYISYSYGFVIHGAIDGYSRLIVYISLENNNSSETVIGLFEKGVEMWVCPASVR